MEIVRSRSIGDAVRPAEPFVLNRGDLEADVLQAEKSFGLPPVMPPEVPDVIAGDTAENREIVVIAAFIAVMVTALLVCALKFH